MGDFTDINSYQSLLNNVEGMEKELNAWSGTSGEYGSGPDSALSAAGAVNATSDNYEWDKVTPSDFGLPADADKMWKDIVDAIENDDEWLKQCRYYGADYAFDWDDTGYWYGDSWGEEEVTYYMDEEGLDNEAANQKYADMMADLAGLAMDYTKKVRLLLYDFATYLRKNAPTKSFKSDDDDLYGRLEWVANEMMNILPTGSGIDKDWSYDINEKKREITLYNSFHVMDSATGTYLGWIDFSFVLTLNVASNQFDWSDVTLDQDMVDNLIEDEDYPDDEDEDYFWWGEQDAEMLKDDIEQRIEIFLSSEGVLKPGYGDLYVPGKSYRSIKSKRIGTVLTSDEFGNQYYYAQGGSEVRDEIDYIGAQLIADTSGNAPGVIEDATNFVSLQKNGEILELWLCWDSRWFESNAQYELVYTAEEAEKHSWRLSNQK